MGKYKVKYVRTVAETYEAIIEAKSEEEAMDVVFQAKYGKEIKGEKLIESYSDDIDIEDMEKI